jgi:hypothetical protein
MEVIVVGEKNKACQHVTHGMSEPYNQELLFDLKSNGGKRDRSDYTCMRPSLSLVLR